MNLTTYLTFNGNCADALRFYQETLGATVQGVSTYGESPMAEQAGPDWKDKVMHSRLEIAGTGLMASDAPPHIHRDPQGFSLALGTDDVAEAERIFSALSQGGTVEMPLAETFWAVRFGTLRDRFGISWMVNCESRS